MLYVLGPSVSKEALVILKDNNVDLQSSYTFNITYVCLSNHYK